VCERFGSTELDRQVPVGITSRWTSSVERISFNALAGADNITVNDLTGTDAIEVDIDHAAIPGGSLGDGRSDKVTINATVMT
jgi:hypothetical protein